MKISEKQLLILWDICTDTLRICGIVGGYDEESRIRLVNEILNQQNNTLIDVNDKLTQV